MSDHGAALAPTPPAPDCDVLLIDLSSLFYPAWHASADADIGRAFEDTLAAVARLKHAIPHKHMALCCDHPPYWRKKVAPSYKAQRDAPTAVFLRQFERTRERLVADGHMLWRIEGYEADDLIATAMVKSLSRGMTVTIATGDKDLAQLVSEHARLYSVNTCEVRGPKEVREKFGVDPNRMRDLLALWGDKSDNIPGVPGVGAVKAAALLAVFGTGSEAIAAARAPDAELTPEQLKALTPAIRKALAAHDGYELAYQLVGLKYDAPLVFDELFQERKPLPIAKEDPGMQDEVPEAEYESAPRQTAPSEPPAAPVQPAPRPRTELAVSHPVATSFEMALEPTSMGAAQKMAVVLSNSRLYPRFADENAIFAIIVRGREMGIGALTALDCIMMVEGRPTMGAHFIVARAMAHPNCEYFTMVDSNDQHAVYETKSRASPRVVTHKYTYAQAVSAGVAPENPRRTPVKDDRGKDSRGQWEKRPAEMLRKTCAVQLARIVYPDAALGLYATEEISPDES